MDTSLETKYTVEEIREKMQTVSRSDGSIVTFFKDESGEIRSTIYKPFPGVSVVQKDVHLPEFITNWRYGPVNAVGIEYCREGSMEYRLEDEEIRVMPGDILITRTDCTTRVMHYPSSHYHAIAFMVYLDEPSQVLNFHLGVNGVGIETLLEKYLPGGRKYSILRKTPLLSDLFGTLPSLPESVKSTMYGIAILGALTLLTADITEINEQMAQTIPKHQADMAKEVYAYVMKHPDERYSTEELAKKFSISPTQLKKYFQVAYGTSIQKFIREQKLKAAAIVFETSGKSVTDVAQMFGYSNISKFSEAFKRVHGEYPKQYRMRFYRVSGETENV